MPNSGGPSQAPPQGPKRLFKDLGIWPSVCILQYFTSEEIIETIRRVNKQALFLCRKTYAPKGVFLHKINLGTVKFFERAEEIKITKDSLSFFHQYKENFFVEILSHYKKVRRLTINLNFLFEEDKKDKFIDMICALHKNEPLREGIQIFNLEDAMLNAKNLETLFKSNLLHNIQYLKLPKNSLGNKGIEKLFQVTGSRFTLIKKIDLSSNHIMGEEGARFIA